MILKDSFVTSPKILVWGDLGSFSWQMFHEVHKVGRSDQDAAQSSKFTISKFISNFFYHVSSAINNILEVLILETLNCEKSFMWTKFMNKNEKLKLMDSPSEGSNSSYHNLNLERTMPLKRDDFFLPFWVELCWHKSANHLEIRAADKIHTGVLSQLKLKRMFTNFSQVCNDYFHISVYPWINYNLSEWYVGIKKFRLHMIVLWIDPNA